MKLLMLITELGYGGAEGAFLRLASAFSEAGHEIELVLFQTGYRSSDYAAADIKVDLPVNLLDDEQRGNGMERWRRRSARLRALKESFGPDAVISFLSGPNLLNALTGGPGLKLVSIRGSRLYGGHMRPPSQLLYHRLLDPLTHRLADGIVGCSEGVTYEVSNSSPRRPPPPKFRTIAGYADAERLIASAAAPPPPGWEKLDGEALICGLGRMAPDKGFQHLIRLLPKVRKRATGARLLLIGDGPYLGTLKDRCDAEGLSWSDGPHDTAVVLFAGYQPQPLALARLARLHVLASESEGLPNVMLEVLAAGLQTIVGDIPWGVRDVFGIPADPDNRPDPRSEPLDAGIGWLMPRIDDASHDDLWVERLVAELTDCSDQAERIAKARERVRAFDVRHAAARWTDYIAELQAKRR